MHKTLAIFLFAFITINVVAGVVFFFGESSKTSRDTSSVGSSVISVSNNTSNSVPVVGSSSISQTELAKHNSANDCWVAYSGKVYDVTQFLPKHPGSAAAIIPYCGTSEAFTKAFTQQHGTSKAGMLMRVGVLIGDFDVVGKIQ